MLILTRRVNEQLVITDSNGVESRVEVLGMQGGQVRLGITAPREVTVDRAEIYERKQAEKA